MLISILAFSFSGDPLLELSVSVDSLSCDVLGSNTAPGSSFCARQTSPTDRCLVSKILLVKIV